MLRMQLTNLNMVFHRPKFIQVMVNLRRLLSAIMKGSTSIFIAVLVNHPCNMRYSIFYLGCEGEERNFKFVQSNESLATFKVGIFRVSFSFPLLLENGYLELLPFSILYIYTEMVP